MGIKGLVRGVAYVALAGALLATAVALNNRRSPTPSASNGDPSANSGALDPEIGRCKALGADAAQNAACKAAWQANRERFLESKKLPQQRVAVPAVSDPKPSATPSREQRPRSARGSLIATHPDAPKTPHARAERSQ